MYPSKPLAVKLGAAQVVVEGTGLLDMKIQWIVPSNAHTAMRRDIVADGGMLAS
jgi:hypothetical protein